MRDGKYVVLCIDDDQDIRSVLQMILEGNGYIPVLAESAEQGFKVYTETNPDFIIVDMMIESADSGTDFAKKTREQNETIPIYMLSSIGDGLSMNVDPSDYGLTGILQKPINADSLLSVLKAKLG